MKKPAHLKLRDPVQKKRIKGVPSDYETRRKQYLELKELRQSLKERKAKKTEAVIYIFIRQIKSERKRINEARKRKELNDLKSGSYQIVKIKFIYNQIKNPEKIKKWKQKARKLLQRVPPEIFYENSKNN